MKNEWISMKKYQPKEKGWYFCTVVVNDKRMTRELYYNESGKWIDNIRKNMFDLYTIRSKLTGEIITEDQEAVDWTDLVIAWMDRPKEYKGECDEDY